MYEDILAKLTEEQKNKLKQAKDMDELMEILGDEGIELPPDVLDKVAGGRPLDPVFRDPSKDRFSCSS